MTAKKARLRAADNPCVGAGPILRRTCAQPVMIRAMPENEIPPAMRVDYYKRNLPAIRESKKERMLCPKLKRISSNRQL